MPKTTNVNPRPIKVTVTFCQSGNKPYIIRWKDLKTGKYQRKSTGTKNLKEAEAIAENKRVELGIELLNSDLDTYEKRIRKYKEIQAKQNEMAKKKWGRKGPQSINSHRQANLETGISPTTARRGIAVIDKAEELKASGDESGYLDLMLMLNSSPFKAFEYIGGKYKNSKSAVCRSVSRLINTLAQDLDKLAEYSKKTEYRDECMSLLKKLSAKYNEWRASE